MLVPGGCVWLHGRTRWDDLSWIAVRVRLHRSAHHGTIRPLGQQPQPPRRCRPVGAVRCLFGRGGDGRFHASRN
jgi:hypothetical protein